MEASSDSFAWGSPESTAQGQNVDHEHEVMSPEEILEEAFGELDQLDAAMLQLAPRKLYVSNIFNFLDLID